MVMPSLVLVNKYHNKFSFPLSNMIHILATSSLDVDLSLPLPEPSFLLRIEPLFPGTKYGPCGGLRYVVWTGEGLPSSVKSLDELVEPVIVYPRPPCSINPELVVSHKDAVTVLVLAGDGVCGLQS